MDPVDEKDYVSIKGEDATPVGLAPAAAFLAIGYERRRYLRR